MRSMIQAGNLLTNATTPMISNYISTGSADEASVSIVFNGATGVKINFLASINGQDFHSIEGTAMNAGDTFMTSTTLPQIYSFDVSMSTSFKIQIETITGGSVSAYATTFSVS